MSEWSYREEKQRLRKSGTAVLPPPFLLHVWRKEGYAALAHRIDGRTCRPVANRMSVGWCCCAENASDGGGAWVEGSGSPPLEEEEYNLLLEGISIDLVTNGLLPDMPLIVSISLVSLPASDLEVVLAAGFDEADVGLIGSV